MKPVSYRDRLRYRFDNMMTRGTRAKIGLLGLSCIAAVALLSLAVWLLNVAPGKAAGNLPLIAWKSLLRLLDPGTMGSDTGAYGLIMLIVTAVGIFITASLIAIINNGIQDRLNTLRKGRSRVIETNHVVIMGWSEQVFTVISELVEANRSNKDAVIVILCDRDPVEMEDSINSRIPDKKNTRVICRQGNTSLMSDFEIVSLDLARAIIVLSQDDDDSETIKTLLAILNNPHRKKAPYHIVAEIRDPGNLQVAKLIDKDNEVELLMVGDFIARIIAQTCRQPGLSLIYTELLDFEKNEIYFIPAGPTAGSSFGEAISTFENSSVIGFIGQDNVPHLNPPMDTPIGPDDQLISIQLDDTPPACVALSDEARVLENAIRGDVTDYVRAEKTLILGWNRQAWTIIRELDEYAPDGSSLTVAADIAGGEEELRQKCAPEKCRQKICWQSADFTNRSDLDRLEPTDYDHIILLPDDGLPELDADWRTLVTLVNLRDIARGKGHPFTIVSEMKDIRTRDLAMVTRIDDFIVSDNLVSHAICQICENKHLAGVFRDIFNSEGSEIYLKPVSEYVEPGIEVNFLTVVEAARRRNEVAIGYKIGECAANQDEGYGVKLNPCKSVKLVFKTDDRVIVLAES